MKHKVEVDVERLKTKLSKEATDARQPSKA